MRLGFSGGQETGAPGPGPSFGAIIPCWECTPADLSARCDWCEFSAFQLIGWPPSRRPLGRGPRVSLPAASLRGCSRCPSAAGARVGTAARTFKWSVWLRSPLCRRSSEAIRAAWRTCLHTYVFGEAALDEAALGDGPGRGTPQGSSTSPHAWLFLFPCPNESARGLPLGNLRLHTTPIVNPRTPSCPVYSRGGSSCEACASR